VRRVAPIALTVALALAACTASPRDPLPPPVPSPPSPFPTASALASAALPRESPRLHDPRWRDARDEDPLEKARLAFAVGAAGLIAGIEDPDPVADTALDALPYAEDAEIALGPLGDLLQRAPLRRRRLLNAILGVAGQPPRQREPLDLEGARRCGEAVLAVAADTTLPREDRALAVSAARALAERGSVDRTRIPAALDPKAR